MCAEVHACINAALHPDLQQVLTASVPGTCRRLLHPVFCTSDAAGWRIRLGRDVNFLAGGDGHGWRKRKHRGADGVQFRQVPGRCEVAQLRTVTSFGFAGEDLHRGLRSKRMPQVISIPITAESFALQDHSAQYWVPCLHVTDLLRSWLLGARNLRQ